MLPLFDPDLRSAADEFIAQHRRYRNQDMSPSELERYQLDAIANTLRYSRANSQFYRHHLRDVQIPATLEQMPNVPFTTKNDLREQLDAVTSLPLGQAWVYYETTGTTGRATPCPRSAWDSIRTGIALCEGYRPLLAKYGQHQTFAVLGPTELHSTGDTFGDVFRSLGHATIKMWPHSPLARIVHEAWGIRRVGW